MPDPFQQSAAVLDLAPRVFRSATVAGSPAAAAETVVAQVSIPDDLAVAEGVLLVGFYTLTIGTDGVSLTTRLRRDSVAGAVVKASGATTVVATALHDRAIVGFDTGAALPNEVYVLTAQVGSASAGSAVTAVELVALVV